MKKICNIISISVLMAFSLCFEGCSEEKELDEEVIFCHSYWMEGLGFPNVKLRYHYNLMFRFINGEGQNILEGISNNPETGLISGSVLKAKANNCFVEFETDVKYREAPFWISEYNGEPYLVLASFLLRGYENSLKFEFQSEKFFKDSEWHTIETGWAHKTGKTITKPLRILRFDGKKYNFKYITTPVEIPFADIPNCYPFVVLPSVALVDIRVD